MASRKISFDGWVLDRESGDLSRDGTRQRLQELPLKVLDLLLEDPGRLVTREQLIAHLWPKGVVDFDTGLNTAVRKLRVALADIADSPRYIETIPRRGYRFIGTIDQEPAVAAEPTPALPEQGPAVVAADTAVPEPTFAPLPPHESPVSAGDISERAVDEIIRHPSMVTTQPRRGWWLGVAAAVVLSAGAAYWLSHRGATPAASNSRVPSAAVPVRGSSLPDQSIAVLPFENLSAEANNEFLALGMAEAVLHRLASLHDLTVIARTSSFAFKDRNEDARQIGRTLNARYLVQGSVQRAGERLRVQAQLIDAASAQQLWSLTFDRPLQDIFALQDEISSRVAEQLSVSLTPEQRPADDAKSSHLEAYLAYLQGQAQFNTGKVADVELSIKSFARAVQIDPRFAAAYAQQSRAIMQLDRLREREDPDNLKRAIALNDRALALDPQLGEAWVQRGSLLLDASHDKDAEEAHRAYQKGFELAPNYGQGFEEYANFLFLQNRRDEALKMAERARQVDPLTPRHHYLKGLILDIGWKNQAEVEPLYLQALKLNPTYHPALVRLSARYSMRGEHARALVLQEKAIKVEPQALWIRDETAATYLILGEVAAARDVLSGFQGKSHGMDVCVSMIEGDHAAALKKAYELYGVPQLYTKSQAQMCAAAEMLRDALVNRHVERAQRAINFQYAIQPGDLSEQAHSAFIWGLPLAQLSFATGDSARGNRIVQSVLATTDQGPKDFYRPLMLAARAGALTLLGQQDKALDALEESVHDGMHMFWWVMDRGTTFDPLKQTPRYKALAAATDEAARKQLELVKNLRASGELPERPVKSVAAR